MRALLIALLLLFACACSNPVAPEQEPEPEPSLLLTVTEYGDGTMPDTVAFRVRDFGYEPGDTLRYWLAVYVIDSPADAIFKSGSVQLQSFGWLIGYAEPIRVEWSVWSPRELVSLEWSSP